jgi:ribosome-binding factor A
MTRRTEQVASLLQQELGELMLGLELPAMTTISRVDVTPDLKHAKVWVTIFSEDENIEKKVLDVLKKRLFYLQGELNRMSTMHHTPKISFARDITQHYVSRIEELLRLTHDDDNEQQH